MALYGTFKQYNASHCSTKSARVSADARQHMLAQLFEDNGSLFRVERPRTALIITVRGYPFEPFIGTYLPRYNLNCGSYGHITGKQKYHGYKRLRPAMT